ncbi:MAG: flagellar hook-basal body complex protein [Candidatus Omnitrophica bacterium]|nr:flagellar hook-basal body complex protein [Candidatus Omnitrophota bacterium]
MTLRSLFSGVSGLRSQSNAMDAIGNNIANVNTVGYKRARITFADLLYQTISGATGASEQQGGTNPVQIGLGVRTDSVDTIFTQGNSQQTGRLLDLSIRGGGFFQLTDGNGGAFFTRAGNFSLDEEGYITMPGSGLRLLGQLANDQGQIDPTQPAQEVQINYNTLSEAIPTDNAVLGGNLSTGETPTAASSLNTLVTVFDEDGLPLGLNAGDTIQISGGSHDTVPPSGVTNFTATDVLTIDATTTLGDLAEALTTTLRNLTGSNSLDVSVDPTGSFKFDTGSETLSNLQITAFDVNGTEKPVISRIFSEAGSGTEGLDADLDIGSNSFVLARRLRQADVTSSTEVFDSQGNARTVVTTFARDTRNVPGQTDTLLTNLFDDAERSAGITVGSTIVIASTSDLGGGAAIGADLTVTTVTAGTTLEDLRADLETALNSVGGGGKTVTLLPDGSFQISSPTAINDMRVLVDPDAGGALPPAATALTRIFANNDQGIDLGGTDGFSLGANTTDNTNSFHNMNSLLNSWNYQILVPHDVTTPPSATSGRLVFNPNGTFQSYGTAPDGTIMDTNPVIEFDPDGTDPENGGVDTLTVRFDFSGITQNASTSTAAILSQDGSPVGRLESVNISQDGTINGVFSNGATRDLAQIFVASFANEGGLIRNGDNLYLESSNSGEPVLGTPGTLSRGTIQSNELELSNVDISEEFVNLILAQRAFQANARVITTGDEVLNEVVNLKR